MRTTHIKHIHILEGEALSDEIDTRQYAAMIVICTGPAWTTADLGFKVSPSSGGTFYPFYRDLSGTFSLAQIGSFAVDKAYIIPLDVFPAGFVKLWSQSGGNDVSQTHIAGLPKEFVVILKD